MSSQSPQSHGVAVIGAGIVGVTTALSLQSRGAEVTLIDRGPPGHQTSFGNTGVLLDNPWLVINNPNLLRKLPGLLTGRNPAVRINVAHAATRLGFFTRFLSYCLRDHAGPTALATTRLLNHSREWHLKWIAESGAQHLVRETGWLKVFRSRRSVEAFAGERALMDQAGTKYRIIAGEELPTFEPALAQPFEQGLFLENALSLSDPLSLTERYAELFKSMGGRILHADIRKLEGGGTEGWRLNTEGTTHTADKVVLATGPWSKDLAATIGYNIPMFWERGYHRHLAVGDGPVLSRPVHDVDRGYVMTPQSRGIRVTSGTELSHRDAAPHFGQIDRSVNDARKAANLGDPVDDQPWMGSRPSLIDGRPMIGAAPRHSGLWFNFGHHHIGLSLSAGSGDLLAALMSETTPAIDPAPFDPARLL